MFNNSPSLILQNCIIQFPGKKKKKNLENLNLFTKHKLYHLAKHELFMKLYKPAEVSGHMEYVSYTPRAQV